MNSDNIGALILAGGKGTRMYSATPKVMLRILEEPMLFYIYENLRPLFKESIWTIVGHGANTVKEYFPEESKKAILQEEQLGTGHALMVAWPELKKAKLEYLLVINGDTPQISTANTSEFIDKCTKLNADLAFMTLKLDDPLSFGRVVRKGSSISAIIEAKDYDEKLYGPEPNEVNAGLYWLKLSAIEDLLAKIDNKNKNAEYYITDLIGLAVAEKMNVQGIASGSNRSLMGVNNPFELSCAEEQIRAEIVMKWQKEGVFIRQAEAVRIGPRVEIEKGADITGPCEIYGKVSLGAEVKIDSFCKILDSKIESAVKISSYTLIQDSYIGPKSSLGPFARLRPGSSLDEEVHVGNFVEIKKSKVKKGAKINHLSYIGDSTIGEKSNIGAGTITCNYDGKNKHQTIIGDRVFIGSNTSLVAPVNIGDNSIIGAGSVITDSVPEGQLAVARQRQINLPRRKTD